MDRVQLIWALVVKEYRELAGRWTSFLFPSMLVFLFILQLMMIGKAMAIRGEVIAFTLLYRAALTDYFMAVFLLCAVPMIPGLFAKEKLTGTIEWLLASPLGPRIIWIGKAAFLFVWAFSFALIFMVLSSVTAYWQAQTLGLEIASTSPSPPFVLLITLGCAAFALLVSAISLISKPRLVGFFCGLAAIGLIGASSAVLRIAGPISGHTGALGVTIIVTVSLCASLVPMLTRQRILLSGK